MDFKNVSYTTSKPGNDISSGSNLHAHKRGTSIKALKFIGTVIIAIVVLVGGMKLLSGMNAPRSTSTSGEVKGAIAVQDINREFSFPLKDSRGEEIGSIKYMIEKAELRDEIIVKGQRATAIPGRAFAIFTIKITNDFRQPVQINTRDYIRLSVNGQTQELLAPDIHNDPVEVQAISTKYTRLGFPINTSDSEIALWVGEINSEKERLEITLQ